MLTGMTPLGRLGICTLLVGGAAACSKGGGTSRVGALHGALALSPVQEQSFVDAHNGARSEVALGTLGSQPAASNMNELLWDPALAAVARQHAERCVWEHNDNRSTEMSAFEELATFVYPSAIYVGENLYASSQNTFGGSMIEGAITGWVGEQAGYTYTNQYVPAAGHYTQVVWATTRYVGCGVAECPAITGLTGPFWDDGGVVVVCDYFPGGNYSGQYPYQTGAACTSCEPDRTTCNDGLCSGCPDPSFNATGSADPPETCEAYPGTAGAPGVGGATWTGGSPATGGDAGAGGTPTTGGTATGGDTGSGAAQATGGDTATGGALALGGEAGMSGAPTTGGIDETGGATATGGAWTIGGEAGMSGTPTAGGIDETGGDTGASGAQATGGEGPARGAGTAGEAMGVGGSRTAGGTASEGGSPALGGALGTGASLASGEGGAGVGGTTTGSAGAPQGGAPTGGRIPSGGTFTEAGAASTADGFPSSGGPASGGGPSSVATDDDGGCSCSTPRRGSMGASALLFLAFLVTARRRGRVAWGHQSTRRNH
ncbi:MAG: hypothetical protein JW940_09860 [Polyangiaceae bacterium]|nr:hypothetical protein [Polyangiaceae bacterium]